jgi:hypothetical protein
MQASVPYEMSSQEINTGHILIAQLSTGTSIPTSSATGPMALGGGQSAHSHIEVSDDEEDEGNPESPTEISGYEYE